jgi:hypothetical protein
VPDVETAHRSRIRRCGWHVLVIGVLWLLPACYFVLQIANDRDHSPLGAPTKVASVLGGPLSYFVLLDQPFVGPLVAATILAVPLAAGIYFYLTGQASFREKRYRAGAARTALAALFITYASLGWHSVGWQVFDALVY